MNEHSSKSTAKKVKYITSIIYLVVLAFIVGGSYINQQQETFVDKGDYSDPTDTTINRPL